MLTRIVVVAVLLVAALAVFIAARPSELRISRSRRVGAPPDVVYSYLDDFRKWPQWSPWEQIDPQMKRQLSGPPAGIGAVYSWAGNGKVGEGRMTIMAARPSQSVTIRLEFLKPWKATDRAEFDLVPDGAGTRVTWTMSGQNGFLAKALGLFVDVDKRVGTDFETGLARLDSVTTAVANQPARTRFGAAPAA